MKKKLLAICLVIALAATAIVGGTLAYFTDTTEVKNNTFTVGDVSIELDEENWENDPKVYPGEILDKDPTVTNVGTSPCYVRVSVTGLDCLGDDLPIALLNVSDEWTLSGDYYYYDEILDVDETTPALFTQIQIPADLENLDEDTENSFSIDIYAEAVQSDGKPETTTIPVWFGICMG